jgi:hypothetical protein
MEKGGCDGKGWVAVYRGVGLVFGRRENRDGEGGVYDAKRK